MTDGNTGFHVAPVAEDEAMNLASMFRKAADAVVQASTFPKQVAELEARVQQLSDELNRKSVHAEELDRSLHEVREQRDQARQTRDEYSYNIDTLRRQIDDNSRTLHEQQTKLDTMSHDLDTTKAERDSYGLRAMQLEDEVTAWKAKADEGRRKLNDMLSLFRPDEPEPVVEAPKPAETAPNPTVAAQSTETGANAELSGAASTETAYQLTTTEPSSHTTDWPAAEPHPVQATSDPAPFDWSKPHHWDNTKGAWVNDPEPNTDKSQDIPF